MLYVDFLTQRRTAKGSAAFFAHLSERHSFEYRPSECNATLPVESTFQREALQLHQIINRTTQLREQTGQSTSIAVRRVILSRAARLVTLARVQGRYAAEEGYFRSMRTWLAKARKMRLFMQRQRLLLKRMLTEEKGTHAVGIRNSATASGEPLAAEDHDGAIVDDGGSSPGGKGVDAELAVEAAVQEAERTAEQLRQTQREQFTADDPEGVASDAQDVTSDLEQLTAEIENQIGTGGELDGGISEGDALEDEQMLANEAATDDTTLETSMAEGELLQTAVVDAAPTDTEE